MPKIKKALECICLSCGKLKVDDTNPCFARALRFKEPGRRFKAVWELSKGKMLCEMDAPPEHDAFAKQPNGIHARKKGSHGGCGALQASIRRDGMKIFSLLRKTAQDVCIPPLLLACNSPYPSLPRPSPLSLYDISNFIFVLLQQFLFIGFFPFLPPYFAVFPRLPFV